VITRALGTEPDVDVDTFTTEAEPKDVYVLCSDGLTDMIPPREILAIVERSSDLDDAARRLIDAANAGGGEDNITVVLFEIDGEEPEAGETARMPAAVPATDDQDEDTLSPLDAVPAIDTAVIPAAAVREQLQEADTEPQRRTEPRRRILPLVLLILILILLVALAVWGLTR
jgi:PPM family protein phosphatase